MCFTHLCTHFVCATSVAHACSGTIGKLKTYLKRRPWSIEYILNIARRHAEPHPTQLLQTWSISLSELKLLGSQRRSTVFVTRPLEKRACLTFNMASDGRSSAEIATWFLETGSPPHARRRHSCWSLPFRSAPLHSARCRSSSAQLRRGRRRVTSHQYCTHDVWPIGGKGKLGSVLKSTTGDSEQCSSEK